MPDHPISPLSPHPVALAPLALIVVIACGAIGGASFAPDIAILRHFVDWRAAHPGGTQVLVALTQLGNAAVLLPVTLLGIAWAVWRKRALALPMALTVIGGRLTVELIKTIVARPRPSLDAHPVEVHTLSFPSGHAANSMIILLSLALWLTPARWRPATVAAAIATSLIIGATRPMLGVHYPSDVVAGWSFGLGWVLIFWTLSRRHGRGESAG